MKPTVLIVIALSSLCCGCLRKPEALTHEEVNEIAWYAEDVCHGIERDPYELAEAEASRGKQDIMIWALGTVSEQRSVAPPKALHIRAQRWPLLRQGLRNEVLLIDDAGLLRLSPDAESEERDLYRDAARQENLDRLALVSILLARGRISSRSARADELAHALRQARLEHGVAAGGQLWTKHPSTQDSNDASTSTSETEPTPSTSNPDPFNRRGGF